jgi:FkbM family methyltransferase
MYYTSSMLRSLAPNHYLPSNGIRLQSFSADPSEPLAELMDDSVSNIVLYCKGKGRLHFHTHAWSGSVSKIERGKLEQVSLFSCEPNECWIDFGSDSSELTSISLFAMGDCDQSAKGQQVWLRGVEFFEPQPWQSESFPLSTYADFRFAKVGSLIVPHMDAVIGQAIKHTGAWAPKDLELFEKFVKIGDVVFDIGANIGHHTVFFSKLVGEGGKVIAFEPQQEIFRFASANLALNGCWNTTLMQSCLGDQDGQLYMAPISYEEPNNFGALSVASSNEPSGGELVPVWTLDGLISSGKIVIDRLDFMKVDVQSFELFVLLGARKVIDRFRPKIFLEIAPHWMKLKGYDYREIYKLLEDLGYEFKHVDEGAGVEAGIRQWSGEFSEEWDVLCVPLSLSDSPSR